MNAVLSILPGGLASVELIQENSPITGFAYAGPLGFADACCAMRFLKCPRVLRPETLQTLSDLITGACYGRNMRVLFKLADDLGVYPDDLIMAIRMQTKHWPSVDEITYILGQLHGQLRDDLLSAMLFAACEKKTANREIVGFLEGQIRDSRVEEKPALTAGIPISELARRPNALRRMLHV